MNKELKLLSKYNFNEGQMFQIRLGLESNVIHIRKR